MYSGFAPAMTAVMAAFSTVTIRPSGAIWVTTTSSGAWEVPFSMAARRSSVGMTTGRPSVRPLFWKYSCNSSSVPSAQYRPGWAGV